MEDFHFSSIFEYTDQDGTTRRFAGFGLDSGESDYSDSNIYRFMMYVLAHPQSEDVLFSLRQFDVLRVLQILDDVGLLYSIESIVADDRLSAHQQC